MKKGEHRPGTAATLIGDVNGKLVAVAAARDVGGVVTRSGRVVVQAVVREMQSRADFRVVGVLKSPAIQSLKCLRRML